MTSTLTGFSKEDSYGVVEEKNDNKTKWSEIMGNCFDCKNNIEGSGELTDNTFITCRRIQKAISVEMIKEHGLFSCKHYEKK